MLQSIPHKFFKIRMISRCHPYFFVNSLEFLRIYATFKKIYAIYFATISRRHVDLKFFNCPAIAEQPSDSVIVGSIIFFQSVITIFCAMVIKLY